MKLLEIIMPLYATQDPAYHPYWGPCCFQMVNPVPMSHPEDLRSRASSNANYPWSLQRQSMKQCLLTGTFLKDTILGHKNKGEREVRQRRRKANTRLCVTKLAASTEENIASCSVMPVGCLLTGQRKPLWSKSPSLVFHWSKFGPGFNSSAFLSRAAWPLRSLDPRSKRSYGLRGPTREQVFTLR